MINKVLRESNLIIMKFHKGAASGDKQTQNYHLTLPLLSRACFAL